jgi:hypothetical protein
MEILGERPVWSMSGGEMVSTLDDTYGEIARLETLALHLTAGLETIGYAKEVGAGTTARFLTFRYRIDATKARRDVHLANALSKYPAVADALPDPNPDHAPETAPSDTDTGEGGAGSGVLLHPAQAEAIVSALDKLPTTVPVEDLQVAEREMVELGRTHGPLDLRKAGVPIRNRLDTDGPEPAEQKAYDRETLQLKTADNGVAFTGFLANENAELFRTLIHTHAKPHKTIDGALDPRSRNKRQADALITALGGANAYNTGSGANAYNTGSGTNTSDLAGDGTGRAGTTGSAAGSADGGATGSANCSATGTDGATRAGGGANPAHAGHGPKPHITITIDFNDLKSASADKIGHLIYGEALSAATIRRLACDAHILPIVLGSDSQPLDVGTTVRLATGPMRKALITRDKGCVCCGAPPIYCDAHHVISWIDGGETKIDNLVLLCKRCHRDLHAGSWDIHIADGIVDVARPTWATPDPVPRGRYRRATTTFRPAAATSDATRPEAARPEAARPEAAVPGMSPPDAATSGTSARAWPRDTDPPWITAEAAARLNPWGEGPERVPDERAGQASAPTGTDIWGEDLGDEPIPRRQQTTIAGDIWEDALVEHPVQPRNHRDAGIDPWGDEGTSPADRPDKPAQDSRSVFDPWGDLVPDGDDGDDGADEHGRPQAPSPQSALTSPGALAS